MADPHLSQPVTPRDIFRRTLLKGSIDDVEQAMHKHPALLRHKGSDPLLLYLAQNPGWEDESVAPRWINVLDRVLAGTPLWRSFAPRPCPVDALNDRRMTALHMAANVGHPFLVKALLARGATVDLVDDTSSTALHYAASPASDGHARSAQILLDAGANPNLSRGTEQAALHNAVRWAHPALVNALLAAGADPNLAIPAWPYNTPLMVLCETSAKKFNDVKTVAQALLIAGADPCAVNGRGETVLSLSITQKHNTVLIPALIEAGADPYLALSPSSPSGKVVDDIPTIFAQRLNENRPHAAQNLEPAKSIFECLEHGLSAWRTAMVQHEQRLLLNILPNVPDEGAYDETKLRRRL